MKNYACLSVCVCVCACVCVLKERRKMPKYIRDAEIVREQHQPSTGALNQGRKNQHQCSPLKQDDTIL